MTDSERPNLTLDSPPGRLATRSTSSRGTMALIVVLQVAVVVLLIVLLVNRDGAESRDGNARADEARSTALALEDRGLNRQAAAMWQQYIDLAPGVDDRAKILFRAGELLQKSEDYETAVTAFVRAEEASGDDRELTQKIGRHIVDCLRSLGRYGEVGRELSRRVDVTADGNVEDRVLATFAGEQLRESDLDRMVERRVDQVLAMRPSGAGEQQRAAILKQYSEPQQRQRLLQELIQTELFSRRAVELGIDRDDDFIAASKLMKQNLLSTRFLQRELGRIEPTDVDIESYFAANQKQYETPESMDVSMIELAADDDVAALLEQIMSPDEFRKIARNRADGDDAKPPVTLIRGRRHHRLGDTEPLFAMAADQWTRKPVANGETRFLVLVEAKTPSRIPDLSEIRQHVELDYRSRKHRELTDKLYRDLMLRYDVQVASPDETPEGGDSAPDESADDGEE